MKIKNTISLLIILFLLSACTKKEEIVKIKDKNFSDMLLIQKVEGNTTSEELTKTVKDKQKIKEILTMVDGLKVQEKNGDDIIERMKSQDYYTFAFAEGDKMVSGEQIPYAFSVFNDGTFVFSHEDINLSLKPRVTIKKHKELFNEIKKLLKVDF